MQCQSLEKERDFYFDKVRSLPLLGSPADVVWLASRRRTHRARSPGFARDRGGGSRARGVDAYPDDVVFDRGEAIEVTGVTAALTDWLQEGFEVPEAEPEGEEAAQDVSNTSIGGGGVGDVSDLRASLPAVVGGGEASAPAPAAARVADEEETF